MCVYLFLIRVHSLKLLSWFLSLYTQLGWWPQSICVVVASQNPSAFCRDRGRAVVGLFGVGDEIGDVKLFLQ